MYEPMSIEDMNYQNDARVMAIQERWWDEVKGLKARDKYTGEWVPIEFQVCWVCDGTGTHVNPSIDASGLTQADFEENPDLYENYFSGMYDQECNLCHGEKVVPVRLNHE